MSGAVVVVVLGRFESIKMRGLASECGLMVWIPSLPAIIKNFGGLPHVLGENFPGSGSRDLWFFFYVMHRVIRE